MAEGNIPQDKFSCSVCLDLLKDPVTIPCGHSYCMSCITNYWNQDDQRRNYSCPQCRQTFTSRPALNKNVMFAEMVEELKTRLQTVSDQCYAGPEDVKCDVCTERKYKAVKSCLECLNSYCQNHLQQHEQFFHVNKHNLMDPTRRLNDMICTKHRKHLEIYCRTDQECICYLCTMDEHKNHDTVTAVAERTEKLRVLGETQRNFKQRIQEREKKLQELRDAVNSYQRSAQTAVEDSERIFTELIRSIERSRSEVTQLIRDQEKTAVSPAEGVLKRLEQEIDDLRRRDTELEQLLHTDNHIHFLKSFQCLSAPPESTVSHDITVSSLVSFDDVRKSVCQLKEKLEDFCREEIEKISEGVSYITIVPDEPKMKEEFLQYFRQFTLDFNTVNEYIRLSDGNTAATNTDTVQQYPDHPDRFNGWRQVLCSESVCGRCYWEVERSCNVNISVSYKSISRKGQGYECVFGFNDQSWSLICSDSTCSFWHNNERTGLPVVSSSCRIGVFLDHRAGILSFYGVSDTMTLIHRVQTTFTHPLYPGFTVYDKSTVKVCRLTKS
ncbi:tripartite motif-containing protein 16-like [Triplophysa rosa]|uniref:FinTRIM family n=1 Tax=Triplophysa rosa TaxID=992332 RepID=A0A9W7TAZ7_TRIRA|nr:tripartite motif-containing protein 16-like [Triplophysa rosa]KAI7792864.1 finTRIM family [Triplophysa rosa]